MLRLLPCLLAAACAVEMDTEVVGPHAQVLSDCTVEPSPGPPVAVELPEGSLWLWEASSAVVARGSDPCAGLSLGAPLVPLLPEEIAENETRTDGRRIGVTPRGGFFAGGLIHLYYDLVVFGPGIFDAETLGTGLCTTADAATPCVRDASFVFPPDRGWPVHGVVGADGLAYLLGCYHAAAFRDLCGAARVAPERAADSTAYEYFSWAQDGWIADPRQFTVAFENAGAITPSYDPAGGRWLVVTADIFSSEISLRTSAQPWDGWSDPEPLLSVVPPSDWFIGGGREHASLRSDDGKTLAISYANPTLHLARVRLP